jgi:radical SAM superfamily enzyme YgiQ (UPF0313 family)
VRALLISTPHPLEENPLPPLSLAYLAAVLERDGHEVRILDFLVTPYRTEKVCRALDDFRPHLVGATCVTMNYPLAAEILKTSKDILPEAKTVIGGPHVSFTVEETLRGAPWIDFVVIGEGERTIVELARAVDSGDSYSQVCGIACAEEGTVVRTPQRALIADLDELPLPSRHLVPIARYHALGTPCTVITSRGCPYGCLFCSAHRMFGRGVRFRDPGLVVDEIEQIRRDLGFGLINIVDDTFTVNHAHVTQVCEEMLRRNLDIIWSAYARVDNMSDDIVRLMKRAGCTTVLFGLESADEAILKRIRKGITPDAMRQGVRIATEGGLRVYASFIIGLPGESPETIRTSMSFAEEINTGFGVEYGYHILAPLPGTDLYDRAGDYGIRLLTDDWAHFDANRPIVETDSLTPQMATDAMAVYDDVVEKAWAHIHQRARAGDQQFITRLAQDETRKFVWHLLQADAVADPGACPAADHPDPAGAQATLATELEPVLPLPKEVVRRQLGKLVGRGLIAPTVQDGATAWQWRNSLAAHPS